MAGIGSWFQILAQPRVWPAGAGTVRIWDVRGPSVLHMLAVGTAPVADAAFTPDGRHVVAVSEDGTKSVWVLATGRSLAKGNARSGIASHANGRFRWAEGAHPRYAAAVAATGYLIEELERVVSEIELRAGHSQGMHAPVNPATLPGAV